MEGGKKGKIATKIVINILHILIIQAVDYIQQKRESNFW